MKPVDPTIAAVVRQQTGVPWSRARSLCIEGRVTIDGERCVDPATRVTPDMVVAVHATAPRLDKGPLPRSAIVFHDRDVVVVHKPAGMLSVADEAGNKDTLLDHTRTVLRRMAGGGADARLGVVHRLDKETSGLMVFTRTAAAKRFLAAQFREHSVERLYHAIAHGVVAAARMDTFLVLDRGDGLRGSYGHWRAAQHEPPPGARRSVTHVRPIAELAGATLVECRLETGRQHQIRIHLAELGHPLVGERVYIRDYDRAPIRATRPMLHARTLGFTHPGKAHRLVFECEPPDDFAAMVESLRMGTVA